MSDAQQHVDLDDLLHDKLAAVLTSTIATQYGELSLSKALGSGDERVFGDALIRLGQLGKEVRDLLVKDRRFPGNAVLQMRNEAGSSNLYPNMVGVPLLRRVLASGSPDDAIEWLQRVLKTNEASGRTIEALWGVAVKAEISLLPDLKIVPFDQLSDSSQKQLLMSCGPRSQMFLMTLFDYVPPKSALVVNRVLDGVIHGVADARADDGREARQIDKLLADVTLVLTLVGPRVPVSSFIWFEFDDPDLQHLAPLADMYRGRRLEILPSTSSDYPPLEANEAQALIRGFLALNEDTKQKLRIALQRLNLAQRRRGVGDRAVEVCIALEILLGDEGCGEVAHKVTIRSALLVGGRAEERRFNADVVKATYGFRRMLVHHGSESTGKREINGIKVPVTAIVDSAVKLCMAVTRVIIQRGEIPDWSTFDVGNHAYGDASRA
jgi:Apea-like HEPN